VEEGFWLKNGLPPLDGENGWGRFDMSNSNPKGNASSSCAKESDSIVGVIDVSISHSLGESRPRGLRGAATLTPSWTSCA
jgi:hypothetical protein